MIYGSIGAIIAFLIWLNLSLTALLLGAVFNQALLLNLPAHENFLPKSEILLDFFRLYGTISFSLKRKTEVEQ